MKPAYYNEHDPYAAAWLRNLIAAGHIAPGDVDERSITDVRPDDLRGYGQCHFFAGMGGWSVAMRLAGVPDDRPVWTGSCPCQPFSVAGAQRGSNDERHLWPAFFDLIRECRPASVFGEQVAGAAGLAWLDHVCADLEGAGYAAAAADLCAAGAGAFHIRQRLYWVAHADSSRRGAGATCQHRERNEPGGTGDQRIAGAFLKDGGLWNPNGAGQQARDLEPIGNEPGAGELAESGSHNRGLADSSQRGQRINGSAPGQAGHAAQRDATGLLGNAGNAGNEGLQEQRRFPGVSRGASGSGARQAIERADASTAWADVAWINCSDGKARPAQPGIFPLAHGLSGGRVAVGSAVQQAGAALSEEEAGHLFSRVGVLRGAGNAIVPQVAAAFVRAAA
jgi:DNA (cytosine-5)-methyltransferase 1